MKRISIRLTMGSNRFQLKMSPLHWAVVRRFPDLVSTLLKHGADPTAASKFDKTPISLALETKQNEVFQELVTHNEMTTSQQEQQEATNSLVYEMEKDNQSNLEPSIIYESPESSPTHEPDHATPIIESKSNCSCPELSSSTPH